MTTRPVLGLRFGSADQTWLAELRRAEPTYSHIGSTLDPELDFPGRHSDRVVLGTGDAVFAAGRDALRAWRPQRAIGATVVPAVAPDRGETVVLGLGLGPLRLLVPDRIVAVVDQPLRYGYAYGTLPGHPERGEELFLIEENDDGVVTATIRVDAEPAAPLRHLGPVVRPLQHLALRRYLAALVRATGPDS